MLDETLDKLAHFHSKPRTTNPGNAGYRLSFETGDPIHWVREQIDMERRWAGRPTTVNHDAHMARAGMFSLILGRLEFLAALEAAVPEASDA